MRCLLLLASLFCPMLGISLPAAAQEAIYVRIRSNPDLPAEAGGSENSISPEDPDRRAFLARQAFLAREAVWERSRMRAEIAIASICTGCLKALRAPSVRDEVEAVSAAPSQMQVTPIP